MKPRVALLLLMAVPLAAGCAGPRSASPGGVRAVSFGEPGSATRVVAYGSLGDLLPEYDATPVIERWLYGPNDFGKTVLRNPQGMALLGRRLLVCDQGQPDLIAIDLDTGQSAPWGDPDHRPRCPVAVTTDQQGSVYVADATLCCLLVYGPDERFAEELRPSKEGSPRFRPAAVLAWKGVLYAADLGRRRVERWDGASRQWLSPLSPPPAQGSLVTPSGLAMTSDGVLLVVDAIGGRVFRVTADGRWLPPIGKPGRQAGEFIRPKQICVTPSGLILVADAGRQSVLVFNPAGEFVTEVCAREGAWGGLTLPAGLVALGPGDLPAIAQRLGGHLPSTPDAWVVVSDVLGSESLTLLGVFSQPARATAHAE